MAEIASVLPIPIPFTFEGTEYRVMGRDFEIEGQFEIWLEDQDLNKIRRRVRKLHDMEYAAMMEGHRRDCATNQFAYGGLLFWQALATLPGRKYMAMLQLSKGTGCKVEMDVIEKVFASAKDLEAFEDAQNRANADPNLEKPWATEKKSQ